MKCLGAKAKASKRWLTGREGGGVRITSGQVKFHRKLQVGLTMSRDLIDGGMGLDGGLGLDPNLFFTDGTWFILI